MPITSTLPRSRTTRSARFQLTCDKLLVAPVGRPPSSELATTAAVDEVEFRRLGVGTPSVKKMTFEGIWAGTVPATLRSIRRNASSQLVLPPGAIPLEALAGSPIS